MLFRWLKRLMPRGLQGRAILILLVPVVAVQLVVSVVFIQRHFDRVTAQMTRSLTFPLEYLLAEVEAAPDLAAARGVAADLGQALDFEVALGGGADVSDRRRFYDFSGRSVIATMSDLVPGVAAIDLWDTGEVRLAVETRWGPSLIVFPRSRVSASNPHQLLVIMVFAGIVMTAVAYLFLRNQLRPITRLAAAAQAYGRGQILPYRPRGAVEVRAAGAAFVDMRARLERARGQRTLLLSGVSHDLRTPLTRLRLGLSLAEDSEETRAMLGDVAAMERMLDHFLAAARGEMLGEAEPARPADIARRVVENAGRIGRTVELELSGEAEREVQLRAEPVERAVDNLVQNALRHGSAVRLAVATGADWLRFTVEDDGPGIPPDRREEALAPFTRLDPSRNQDQGGGAGLGLAIALDVARGHGGTLRLGQSERLGGLSADLVLPR